MRQNLQVTLLILMLFGLTNCKKTTPNIFYKKQYVKEIKEARKEATFFTARNFIPGSSAAIYFKGELIYSEGIGLASSDLDVPVTRKTKFRIGELSQLFTSAIYNKLLEEGTLSEDSAIQKYYPQFPVKSSTITPQLLAYETAGITTPMSEDKYRGGINISLEKAIDRFKDTPLSLEPNIYQIPSIYNYNLLGVVMEKASGKNYRKLLTEYVTDTLNLENTEIDNVLTSIKNRSNFFELNLVSQVTNSMFYDLRQNVSSEGLLSNAEDLATFGNAILHSEYFSGVRDRIFKKIVLKNGQEANMANGWVIYNDREGRLIYGRQGSVPGGGGSLIMYPEYDLVVAFTCNVTASLDETPVFSMAAPFLPEIQPETEEKQ
ncbi:serine hydrolase domain-containing protein [Maribellus sp. YY47]|uniref:serine hydrolase domain-containing protein n=1 Tax=Maribellus sp. YY47 TaxID=2929486 RepID=UPI00200111F6|nr:serine hydrolase domain-containing protein [Maribellus sp. YY47]MCK3684215.1 beta-lactamase family protein [Maribellus sp. YY47]